MSDRKYSQRGYQDSGSGGADRSQEKRSPRPRDPFSAPRGRGLGKPTHSVFRCAVCGSQQAATEVALGAVCGKCQTDLHTCTHCRSFDSSAVNECRQPITERIASKAKNNSCELFVAKATQEFAKEHEVSTPSDAKSAFDALFKL